MKPGQDIQLDFEYIKNNCNWGEMGELLVKWRRTADFRHQKIAMQPNQLTNILDTYKILTEIDAGLLLLKGFKCLQPSKVKCITRDSWANFITNIRKEHRDQISTVDKTGADLSER